MRTQGVLASLRTYTLPVLLALLLHAMVASALMLRWQTKDIEVVARQLPSAISGQLVLQNPIRQRQRQREEAALQGRVLKERRLALAKVQEEEAQDQASALQRQQAQEEEARRQAERRAAALRQSAQAREETEAVRRAALHSELQDSLVASAAPDEAGREAITDDEQAFVYAEQIRQDIRDNWSRPPSARNGMQTLLKVFLVPTGEVASVAVVEGSGNQAFDLSAVRAVEKAEPFRVPENTRQFERNFREFTVLFKPEDLRL